MKTILFIFLNFSFLCHVLAVTKCVKAKGKVECKKDRQKQVDVEVFLMDRDTIPPDDTMGHTTTNDDGTFTIEGCGYDFLPNNNPDPYLKIQSYCGTTAGRRIDTEIKQVFSPEISDYGTISLD